MPTSAAAAQQTLRKRLWPVPVAEETEAVASTSAGPSHQQEQELPDLQQIKRNKTAALELATTEVEADKWRNNAVDDTAVTDLNANLCPTASGSDVLRTSTSLSTDVSAGAGLSCPTHYDPEVWDALPRDLQVEIFGEAAPPQPSSSTSSPVPSSVDISNSTPVRSSNSKGKSSKLSRSKQKSSKEKNTILKYLSKS